MSGCTAASKEDLARVEAKVDEMLDIFRDLAGLAEGLSKNPMLAGFLKF
jgi:hypothetical protein